MLFEDIDGLGVNFRTKPPSEIEIATKKMEQSFQVHRKACYDHLLLLAKRCEHLMTPIQSKD